MKYVWYFLKLSLDRKRESQYIKTLYLDLIQNSYEWNEYIRKNRFERAKHWRKRKTAKRQRGILPCLKSLYKKRKSVNTLEIWYRVTKDNIPRDEESQDLRILAQPNITCTFPFSFSLSFDHHEKEKLYNQPNIVIFGWMYTIVLISIIRRNSWRESTKYNTTILHFLFFHSVILLTYTNFCHWKEYIAVQSSISYHNSNFLS